MTGIFVANITSQNDQRAFEGSATQPIERERVIGSFKDTEQPQLEEIERSAQGFYAWAASVQENEVGSWSHLQRDDMVLINYQGVYRHFARVLGRFQNRQAAEAIWGKGFQDREHLYFISQPVPIELPAQALDDYMLEPGQGLFQVGDPICDRIETDFGNLERFARLRLLRHTPQLQSPSYKHRPLSERSAAIKVDFIADISSRRGAPELRAALLAAYGGQCAITANCAECTLEVAYIIPNRGALTQRPSNALLLRADLHNLFDLGRLAVDTDSMSIVVSPELFDSSYRLLQGRPLRLPENPDLHPDKFALDMQRSLCPF
jgi:hypothetical protein